MLPPVVRTVRDSDKYLVFFVVACTRRFGTGA